MSAEAKLTLTEAQGRMLSRAWGRPNGHVALSNGAPDLRCALALEAKGLGCVFNGSGDGGRHFGINDAGRAALGPGWIVARKECALARAKDQQGVFEALGLKVEALPAPLDRRAFLHLVRAAREEARGHLECVLAAFDATSTTIEPDPDVEAARAWLERAR
jgi:hypothetical protein